VRLVQNTSGASANSGVLGSAPASAPVGSASPRAPLPPPPPPPPRHQIHGNQACPPPNTHDSLLHGPDVDQRRHWIPKMDFPKFDGTNARIWLDKCDAYFDLYSIPHDFRVIAASLHMIDKANHWYQNYKLSHGNHTWEHFVVAVSCEFEDNTHRKKTMELLNLRQTGSVADYKNSFDQLVYHIKLYDNTISQIMLVS
jgi:hypothetical protein